MRLDAIPLPETVDPCVLKAAEKSRRSRPALLRFVEKCRHDPRTGCVEWVGGTTTGQGKHAEYGVFWFEGRRWSVHRWAAKFIHGFEIEDMDVDHICRNTLCVRHLQSVTPEVNRELVWIRREVGLEENPREQWCEPAEDDVPFYRPPAWFAPFDKVPSDG